MLSTSKSPPGRFVLGLELLPPRLDAARAVEAVAEGGEVAPVDDVEGHVAAVAGQRGEGIRVAHAEHQRAIAAAGDAEEAAPLWRGNRAVARVDPGDQLLGDVVLVAARGGGVEVLAAAVAREAVGQHDDGMRHPGGVESREAVGEVALPGVVVEHAEAATGVAAEAEEHGIAPASIRGVGVARRQ